MSSKHNEEHYLHMRRHRGDHAVASSPVTTTWPPPVLHEMAPRRGPRRADTMSPRE